MSEQVGPLAGIRVLDLSRVLAGPFCTMTLGDLGAEVIKVERPGPGDDTRAWGPPWAGGESAYYLSANRNKKSITLNLKDPQAQQLVRELVAVSDVVVENFKIGSLEKMGLSYEQLAGENPSVVWATITGYGRQGPDAAKPGYDFITQGETGVMSITGEVDGEPMKVGVAIVDVTTGLYTALAVCAALREREISGLGQRVDSNLYSSGISWLVNVASNHLVSGEPAKRYGNAHANIVPYQAFEASDQWFTLGVGNDRQFRALCEIIEQPELADDARFATNSDRVANRASLIPMLEQAFALREADYWIAACREAVIPCGPINSVEQVFEHPQTIANNMVVEVPHPTAGSVRLTGVPFSLSRTPAGIRTAPPLLGEHNEEIFCGLLGRSAEQLTALREAGVI